MKKMIAWRDEDRFAPSNGSWSISRPIFNRTGNGKAVVDKSVNHWHVYDPVVVSTPSTKTFLPPLLVPEYSTAIHNRLKVQHDTMVKMSGLAVVLFFAMMLLTEISTHSLKILGIVFGIFFYYYIDNRLVVRDIAVLRERALFNNWLWSQQNVLLVTFVLLMLCSAAAQVFYVSRLGSLEELVMRYGVYYAEAGLYQWWRYLVGIFIHATPVQWIANFSIGVMAAGLCGAICERKMIAYFLLFAVFSVVCAQLLRLGAHADGIVGISGGVFGLFGWLIGYSIKCRDKLPRYLYVTLTSIVVMNVLVSMYAAGSSSQTAHVSGMLLGFVFGYFELGARRL